MRNGVGTEVETDTLDPFISRLGKNIDTIIAIRYQLAIQHGLCNSNTYFSRQMVIAATGEL